LSISFNEVILYGTAISDPVAEKSGGSFNLGIKTFGRAPEVMEILEIRFSNKSAKSVFAGIYAGCFLLIRGSLRIENRAYIFLREFLVTTSLFDRDLDIEIPRIIIKLKSDYF
jgi:hypothetical protein